MPYSWPAFSSRGAGCLQKCKGSSREEQNWACETGGFQRDSSLTHRTRMQSVSSPSHILLRLSAPSPAPAPCCVCHAWLRRSSPALRVTLGSDAPARRLAPSRLAPTLHSCSEEPGGSFPAARLSCGLAHPSCSPRYAQTPAQYPPLSTCSALKEHRTGSAWGLLYPPGFLSSLCGEVYLVWFPSLVYFCYSLGLCEYCLEQSKSKRFIRAAQQSSPN